MPYLNFLDKNNISLFSQFREVITIPRIGEKVCLCVSADIGAEETWNVDCFPLWNKSINAIVIDVVHYHSKNLYKVPRGRSSTQGRTETDAVRVILDYDLQCKEKE